MDFLNDITDQLDGLFGVIPFHTFENNLNNSVEVTSRKTQLGFEDNDHRFSKSAEVSLQIVFFGRLKREKKWALETMRKKREKDTLVLLKNYQLYKNMVITDIKERENYDEGFDMIVLDVSFKEIRYGEPAGSLVQETAENTTSYRDMFQQTVGNLKEKALRVKQIFLGGGT
jgi:hypothetical protein